MNLKQYLIKKAQNIASPKLGTLYGGEHAKHFHRLEDFQKNIPSPHQEALRLNIEQTKEGLNRNISDAKNQIRNAQFQRPFPEGMTP